MAFEDLQMDNEENLEATPPPEEASNRTFLIVAGILGGIILLTLICGALYALLFLPQQRRQEATQLAQINLQNTQVAVAAEQTAQALQFTPSPTVTRLPDTPAPSPSPVVAVATEVVASPTIDFRTATVAALLTQAAAAQMTRTPTAAGLPQTGFAEEVGVSGLVGLTLLLIVLIFLARRLRTSRA